MPKDPIAGVLFSRLYALWPKKTPQDSIKKSVEVLVKSVRDLDHARLTLSAKAYLAKNSYTEPRFIFDLGNWIRGDHWKDYYNADPQSIIDTETEFNYRTEKLIRVWNETARKWWLAIADEGSAKETVKSKLHERFFADNWETALSNASILFKRKRTDRFRSTVPSIRWFCSGDTVARLVEGEFGVVEKIKPKTKRVPRYDEPEPVKESDIKELSSLVASLKEKIEEDKEKEQELRETEKKAREERRRIRRERKTPSTKSRPPDFF